MAQHVKYFEFCNAFIAFILKHIPRSKHSLKLLTSMGKNKLGGVSLKYSWWASCNGGAQNLCWLGLAFYIVKRFIICTLCREQAFLTINKVTKKLPLESFWHLDSWVLLQIFCRKKLSFFADSKSSLRTAFHVLQSDLILLDITKKKCPSPSTTQSNIHTFLNSPWEKKSCQMSLKRQKSSIWGGKQCVNMVNFT